jgi:hypothetical protein
MAMKWVAAYDELFYYRLIGDKHEFSTIMIVMNEHH